MKPAMQLTVEQEVTALRQRYLTSVNDQLHRSVPDTPGGLYTMLRYHLGWEDQSGNSSSADTGKSLRSVLCLMAAEIVGGNWRKALPAAAALELIHNFSLIHDDIQDGDTERRHRPTVWSIWGTPLGVTAGNAMRLLADRLLPMLAELGAPAQDVARASLALTTHSLEMIEGQYLDMAFERSSRVTTEQYREMIMRKTGALVAVSMYLGALSAGGDHQTVEAFARCGRHLGLAFQVRDDILGLWGNPRETGKPVGADIRRRKKSLPVVFMLQKAQGSRRKWLHQLYSAETTMTDTDVARVFRELDELGARDYAQAMAEEQRHEAVAAIMGPTLPPTATRQIETMAEYFVSRHK